jgi:hypothetical protein
MLRNISAIAEADNHAASLLCNARGCAEIFLLVMKRQKGCDGMGELAMIKEEFREAVDDLIRYCRDKEYLTENLQQDLQAVADMLISIQ